MYLKLQSKVYVIINTLRCSLLANIVALSILENQYNSGVEWEIEIS